MPFEHATEADLAVVNEIRDVLGEALRDHFGDDGIESSVLVYGLLDFAAALTARAFIEKPSLTPVRGAFVEMVQEYYMRQTSAWHDFYVALHAKRRKKAPPRG